MWGNDPNQRLTIYERLSWGTGFDGVYDTNTKHFTGQMRSQFAYSLARDRELGLWFAYPLVLKSLTIRTNQDLGYQPIRRSTSIIATFSE